MRKLFATLTLGLALVGIGLATAGDYRGGFPVVQPISGLRKTTWQVNNAGAMLPGADAAYNIGSSSYRPANLSVVNMTARGLKNEVSTVTANTTLTTASPAYILCSNATATITMQNATTAGAGYIQHVANIAGSGNVSIASASLIGGDASVNATVNTTKSFVSNGSAWYVLK